MGGVAGAVQSAPRGGGSWHVAGIDFRHLLKYEVGSRLWVRETWCEEVAGEWLPKNVAGRLHYAADGNPPPPIPQRYGFRTGKWRTPIFMPRWACRLVLNVVSVRVKRLREITNDDAEREGAFFTDYGRVCHHPADMPCGTIPHPPRDGWAMGPTTRHDECLQSPRSAFANGWNHINGKRAPWESSPWVWRVEFTRTT